MGCGMGREMGGRFKREGIYVYLWLIHVRFDRKQQNSVKQLSFNKNKLINLKNKNPCFRIWRALGKHFCFFFFFFASCWLWKHFPCKKFRGAWRSGNQLARGQVNMAVEARVHSPIRPTSEALVVQRAVGHCREELGSFCWSMLAAGLAVCGASHRFAEHTSQMQWFPWHSESGSGSNRQQTTKQWS